MKKGEIILQQLYKKHVVIREFEEAYYNSTLQFTTDHLAMMSDISEENLLNIVENVLKIYKLAGINSKQHLQKIYVYIPESETIYIEYKMSKSAINLMLMQFKQLNENRAKWLYELARDV